MLEDLQVNKCYMDQTYGSVLANHSAEVPCHILDHLTEYAEIITYIELSYERQSVKKESPEPQISLRY